jgi:hypothetical protein
MSTLAAACGGWKRDADKETVGIRGTGMTVMRQCRRATIHQFATWLQTLRVAGRRCGGEGYDGPHCRKSITTFGESVARERWALKHERAAEGRGSTGAPVSAFVAERSLIRLNGMNSVLRSRRGGAGEFSMSNQAAWSVRVASAARWRNALFCSSRDAACGPRHGAVCEHLYILLAGGRQEAFLCQFWDFSSRGCKNRWRVTARWALNEVGCGFGPRAAVRLPLGYRVARLRRLGRLLSAKSG